MSRIFVKVKARAKREVIVKIDETHFQISVKDPPVQGKANAAVTEMIADYLKIHKARVLLIAGKNSNRKVFDICG